MTNAIKHWALTFCITRQDKNKENQLHLCNEWTQILHITV